MEDTVGYLKHALIRLIPGTIDPLGAVQRVTLCENRIELLIPASLTRDIISRLGDDEELAPVGRKSARLILPITLTSRRGARSIAGGAKLIAEPDKVLIAALRKAQRMVRRDGSRMPVITMAPRSPSERTLIRLAFLAPDIPRDIFAGRLPPRINLERLMKMEIPLDWQAQRALILAA